MTITKMGKKLGLKLVIALQDSEYKDILKQKSRQCVQVQSLGQYLFMVITHLRNSNSGWH